MLNGLDLFSGIGGLSLALAPWIRPLAYCENDRYAQCVLLSRMARTSLPCAPIWDDIRTLRAGLLQGPPDVIYGGFPCQDISTAGLGEGLGGKRSGLYWELHRLVKEIRPAWVFLENVPAIRTRGLLTVVRSLADLGYDCRWTCVSAAEIGAPHLRKRWFLLAHIDHKGKRSQPINGQMESQPQNDGASAHANSQHLREQPGRRSGQDREETAKFGEHGDQPEIQGMDDGLPHRMDRIRAMGNAVVPQQAREAFQRLMGLK